MRKREGIYIRIGRQIRERRLELNIRQEDLANEVGVHRPSMANMEAGYQRIYLHHLLKISKALKVDVIYFL